MSDALSGEWLNWLPDWVVQSQLLLMFVSAFLSATLLPGNSEVIFSGLLLLNRFSFENNAFTIFNLWWVATVGNSLGSMTSYAIGRMVSMPEWQHLNRRQQQGLQLLARYGSVALLFSWLPIIGDLLCVASGWLRLHWLPSLIFITLGKGLRYFLLIALSQF
ncbi:DedA family protein [Testudinibacter sp. TR-2022]|uniref:YqaA family protein n=1 Tax=Testudinibacter sp. TR-2022 TaxID=2585029 RepID=UPI00111A3D1D|nr:YqaA family protein [Testudinibacter sp. TR-2022]TNH04578.1 DedA family protein [Pasteurellaceae bacterium Phil31]TNH07724.1 DedA family protein [Testudinibacter sp. TR-2022]TNH09805.1 DedA family protein [Testudinibacter sp. TR-2022]TNH13850.1 DedA family protein [Testudinibacter sp. TR-2022]TNH20681.1 DedA family protein [Testudinibacter sp. TR-2022]